ncbi:MAG TPA: hypothetical protein VIJ00_10430 [Nakamurella sp.]
MVRSWKRGSTSAVFYIIEAQDLDAALEWASKTVAAIGAPIEVRPFWDEPGA